tara:strand:- start:6979 stop:8523 length:1545 start_codon:yes stop_codon:yes gene_type:complete
MPRDVMPVWNTPFTRRRGGKPRNPPARYTPPAPKIDQFSFEDKKSKAIAAPVAPKPPAAVTTPKPELGGKGLISSVDNRSRNPHTDRTTVDSGEALKGVIPSAIPESDMDRDVAAEPPNYKLTPSEAVSRPRQPRGDWFLNRWRQKGDDLYPEHRLPYKIKKQQEDLRTKFDENFANMPKFFSKGRAQYGYHGKDRFHQMLPADWLDQAQLNEVYGSRLGAFHMPFNAGPFSADRVSDVIPGTVLDGGGGIQRGHSYASPAVTTGGFDADWGSVIRHETVHGVNTKIDSVLADVREKVATGEASAHARHPWGEVEKTIVDLFPDDLMKEVEGLKPYEGSNFSDRYGHPMDLEELVTRYEDSMVGEESMKKIARKTLDNQLEMTKRDQQLVEDNIDTLEEEIKNFYNPPKEGRGTPRTVDLAGWYDKDGKKISISTNFIGQLEYALEYEKNRLTGLDARVKGFDHLGEYWKAGNEALKAYHEAGGNLEDRLSSYEQIRLPGTYDESWQPGWPRKE